jgi:NAD-dependent dihydropyrimidine dehydrogenase PreA subunit
MVRIELDPAKCTSPRQCRKCMEVCPQRLFRTYPRERRKPGKPAADWTIGVVLPLLCTGCMKCEQVCPQKAIRIDPAQATASIVAGGGITRTARRVAAGTFVWMGKKAYVP